MAGTACLLQQEFQLVGEAAVQERVLGHDTKIGLVCAEGCREEALDLVQVDLTWILHVFEQIDLGRDKAHKLLKLSRGWIDLKLSNWHKSS